MSTPRYDHPYDGNLLELAEFARGEPTGAYIVDENGRRLIGVAAHGTPGIDRRLILEFADETDDRHRCPHTVAQIAVTVERINR